MVRRSATIRLAACGLAGRFYDDRPGCVSIRSYRRAEMAFMQWQVRRGLLAAPDAPRRGANGGSTLSVPAGSVLERLAHVLDLRRRLRLRVVAPVP